jgi:hypothetical protein
MNKSPLRSRYLKIAGSAACLLALLGMLGGHWVLLQSAAWARMIGQYARQGSLTTALVKTFDGKHPCGLCLTIQHGRQQEQAQNNKSLPCHSRDKAPDLLCHGQRAVIPLPLVTTSLSVPASPGCRTDFIETPPTPPPRAA